MRRPLVFAFGLAAYGAFVVVFLALIDFIADGGHVRAIDGAPTAPAVTALAIDLALMALFGISHSVLARPSVKTVVVRIVPAAAERSLYVVVASATLALLVWQWRALPQQLWTIDAPVLRTTVWAIQALGIALVFVSTFLTDHFDLFGLRQTWLAACGRPYTPVPFVEHWLYARIRHPMMVGILVWLWAAPDLSVGHLVFAATMTTYVMIGIWFEERDLVRAIGAPYDDYRRRVRALLPLRRRVDR